MTRTLAIASLLLAGGCAVATEGPPAPGTGSGSSSALTARELFEANVYPILDTKCGGCHAVGSVTQGFVDPSATTAYSTITSSPVVDHYEDRAPIVEAMSSPHQGVTYTDAERAVILEWLAKEREERGL